MGGRECSIHPHAIGALLGELGSYVTVMHAPMGGGAAAALSAGCRSAPRARGAWTAASRMRASPGPRGQQPRRARRGPWPSSGTARRRRRRRTRPPGTTDALRFSALSNSSTSSQAWAEPLSKAASRASSGDVTSASTGVTSADSWTQPSMRTRAKDAFVGTWKPPGLDGVSFSPAPAKLWLRRRDQTRPRPRARRRP